MRKKRNQNPDNCNERCEQCGCRFNCKKRVLLGYERLAFGSTADAFRLLIGDGYGGNIECMNLFNVAEIKKPKDGAMEIKFFDRIKALEHLEQPEESTNKAMAFYDVLSDCAKELKRSESNDI